MLNKVVEFIMNTFGEIVLYVIFGALTTLVNIVVYSLFAKLISIPVIISNILAWFFSVLFAYITNKKWVFKSQEKQLPVLKECINFFIGRLGTGILDTCLMFVFVELFEFNDLIVKICVNVLVIILNYIISKFWVFTNGRKGHSYGK